MVTKDNRSAKKRLVVDGLAQRGEATGGRDHVRRT